MKEVTHEPRFSVVTDNTMLTQACVLSTTARTKALRQVYQIAQSEQGNE
jgi:hypothetical protein